MVAVPGPEQRGSAVRGSSAEPVPAQELEADVFATWAAFDHSRQPAELQRPR